MCDVLQRIHNAVSIVITRIDTPLVSWMWMWSKLKDRKIRPPIHVIMNKLGHWWYSSNYTCLDSISNEVIHVPIITLHVLLHSECRFAFFNHALSHFFKKFQRFCNRSIPPRTVHLLFSILLDLFLCLWTAFAKLPLWIWSQSISKIQVPWMQGGTAKLRKVAISCKSLITIKTLVLDNIN